MYVYQATESLRALLVSQLCPVAPIAHPAPRAPFFWLSVSSHLLYFLYANSLSPLICVSPPPVPTVDLAVVISKSTLSCLASLAQLCASVRKYEILSLTDSIAGDFRNYIYCSERQRVRISVSHTQ